MCAGSVNQRARLEKERYRTGRAHPPAVPLAANPSRHPRAARISAREPGHEDARGHDHAHRARDDAEGGTKPVRARRLPRS